MAMFKIAITMTLQFMMTLANGKIRVSSGTTLKLHMTVTLLAMDHYLKQMVQEINAARL